MTLLFELFTRVRMNTRSIMNGVWDVFDDWKGEVCWEKISMLI